VASRTSSATCFSFGSSATTSKTAGPCRYLIFYLVCGILAGLSHVFATAIFSGGNEGSMLVPSLGASGAISGVLGGYILLFPTRRVVVMISWFFTPVPAFVAIGLWFVFQLISGLGMLGSGSKAGAWRMLLTSVDSLRPDSNYAVHDWPFA
jgi:membrane associated rhomboid family serine protease